MADLAKVSTATVSRVLSGSAHPVAEQTRKRVVAAAESLDFERNLLASGLAQKRTKVVAIIVHDVMDEYFSEIARGIEDEAYENGYATLICNTDRNPEKEVHYLRKLRALQVDAVLFTAGEVIEPVYQTKIARQLALIDAAGGVVVHLAPHSGGAPDIGYSNTLGLALAVDHLVGLGHRSFGFLAGPPSIVTSVDRLAAMRAALDRHSISLPEAMTFGRGFGRADGERAAVEFRAAELPATAVVGANDQAAIGFVRGLRSYSISVPEQVSVVGYDDISPCAYVEPPLTTVHVPLRELGIRGMRRALALLSGETPTNGIELPLKLTVRSSTGPPRSKAKLFG